MTKLPKYVLQSNLSEKQIEADVAAFLGWCTPEDAPVPFRLFDVDEQLTGADKLYNRGHLIYLQFKKSTGLQARSKVRRSRQAGLGALESIREFRDINGLESDPSLYFQLRAKSKTAIDFQHNILLNHNRPPLATAMYVAPLVLDKTQYAKALYDSSTRFLVDPFYYRMVQRVSQRYWSSYFGPIPFLREHVSIIPHERVTTHEHYYAFGESGTDISWHSPSLVSSGPSRLSDALVRIFAEASSGEGAAEIESLAGFVNEISWPMQDYGFDRGSPKGLEFVGRYGRWLHESTDIRQMLLLWNSDSI